MLSAFHVPLRLSDSPFFFQMVYSNVSTIGDLRIPIFFPMIFFFITEDKIWLKYICHVHTLLSNIKKEKKIIGALEN